MADSVGASNRVPMAMDNINISRNSRSGKVMEISKKNIFKIKLEKMCTLINTFIKIK